MPLIGGNILWLLNNTKMSQEDLAALLQTSAPALRQAISGKRGVPSRWEPWIIKLTQWVQQARAAGGDDPTVLVEIALFEWDRSNPVEGWIALASVFDPPEPIEIPVPATASKPSAKADRHLIHFVKLLGPGSGAAEGERVFAYRKLAEHFGL